MQFFNEPGYLPSCIGTTTANESEDTWEVYILENLKQACPVLSAHVGRTRDDGEDNSICKSVCRHLKQQQRDEKCI